MNTSQVHISCSFRVCQGPYDPFLISAWEDYDAKRGSENDHPKEFTREQVSLHLRETKYRYGGTWDTMPVNLPLT